MYNTALQIQYPLKKISKYILRAPANTLFDSDTCIVFKKKARPNNPNTILGTPANVLIHLSLIHI